MSNRYAEKVFAEHPMAMWSFDDKVTYTSQIDEDDRLINTWTLTNATASEYVGLDKPNTPFPDSNIVQIEPTNKAVYNFSAQSPNNLWFLSTTYESVPVSASMFVFVPSNSIDYIDFGSTDGVDYTDVTRNYFPDIASNVWVKVSHFDLQHAKLYFNVVYKENFSDLDVTYLINGLSLSQYGESTSTDSLGVAINNPAGTEDVIVDGALPNRADVGWYEEMSRGIYPRSGYHVVQDNRLLSSNSAMPIAYGSGYLLKLTPPPPADEGVIPSFVFDGCGMFTDQGRYDTYTMEFWLRIGGVTTEPKKIIGPAVEGNLDGLFVCSSTLILSVGNKFASYNIGKLGDPMLIHLVYSQNALMLFVNGEMSASVLFDADTVDLAPDTNQWLGFYSYSDIDPVEIDILSIFGYVVPTEVMKKRFVWGQGVENIDIVNSQYEGIGVFSDFSQAKMTNSLSYPNDMYWEAGTFEGVTSDRDKLVIDQRPFPEVVLSSHTKDQWLEHLDGIVTKDDTSLTVNKLAYFNFKPTGAYDDTVNYALFKNPSTCCKNVDGFSLAFDNTTSASSANDKTKVKTFLDSINATSIVTGGGDWANVTTIRPLFRINKKGASQQFVISYLLVISGVQKVCTFFTNGTTSYLIDMDTPANATKILVLQFSSWKTFSFFGTFFRDLSLLQIVLGSDQKITGDIKFQSFSFFSKYFFRTHMDMVPAITSILNTEGNIPFIFSSSYDSNDDTQVTLYRDALFANYCYIMKQEFGMFYEDLGVRATWEESIPLSRLAGIVQDFEGKEVVSVDSIQYNIGHVAPKSIENATVPGAWTYSDLSSYYSGLSLGFLYLGFFTGYTTYKQLRDRSSSWDISETIVSVDTTKHFIKSYVSLQDGTQYTKERSEIPYIAPLTQANTVYFQAFSDYENMLFEVADGAMLIPPRSVDVGKLIIYLSVDFEVPGMLTYPVSVKSLELAAFAKNRNDFTPIKAKNGKDIYPTVYNETYYDHSAFNPFKVDKRGFPYLYLGKESGFTPLGPKQDGWKKGLQVPMPETALDTFTLDNIQFWVRRGKLFPEEEIIFLDLESPNLDLYFTISAFAGDNTRGVIKVYNKNTTPYLEGTFMQNGNIVTKPVIDMQQWNAIAFSWQGAGIDLGGSANMTVYPGMSYNNISYFATRESLNQVQINYRSWLDVELQTWLYWEQNAGGLSWGELLIEGTAVVKSKELAQFVYDTYVGTRNIQVNGPQPMKLLQDQISNVSGTQWSSTTLIPS